MSSSTARPAVNGISSSHSRPPTRPLRGLRGCRSHSASRSTDQRRVRCSVNTSPATSTNCQIRPAPRSRIRARPRGAGPWNVNANCGATIHASAAMGAVAAAHTARMDRRRYCGMWTVGRLLNGHGGTPYSRRPGERLARTVGIRAAGIVGPPDPSESSQRRCFLSSSGMTRPLRPARSVADMGAGLGKRIERYAPTALAAAFALGALIEDLVSPMVTVGGRRYDRAPEVVVVIALGAAVTLVAFRRRLGVVGPLSALAAVGLAAIPAPAWLLHSSLIYLLVMFVCGLSGYLTGGRVGLLGLGVVWAVASLAEWRNPERSAASWLEVGAFMCIAWCVGLLARRPVSQARSAEQRATRFEREQEEAARRAVTGERHRIARELHDIIAHSVSVMTMPTGAVRRLLLPDQVLGREPLLPVEQTGSDAMSEMRRLVGLLKADDSASAYSPLPSMRSLDALTVTMCGT